ncbi:helix-turn-helix domain-containing protein [Streptomyces sp. RB13]|uniref:helix-turn-helix domain-containing protein n=1 Tax=Streptomyces sp. RB13 TaxID=2950978 RepID=UPI002FCB45AC
MSYRKRIDPERARAAILADVQLMHDEAMKARRRMKIRIYLAAQQGFTTREIAATVGISQAAVSRYRIDGEAAFKACQQP